MKEIESIRGYYRTNKAWYGKNDPEINITFGLYYPDGGTDGEMSMVWEMLGNKLIPKLKSYYDSWVVLSSFTDLIKRLGELDNKTLTDDEFSIILNECGFKDLTPYESPYRTNIVEEVDMVTLTIPKAKAIDLKLI